MSIQHLYYAGPEGMTNDHAKAKLIETASRVAVLGWPEGYTVTVVSAEVGTPEEVGKPEVADIEGVGLIVHVAVEIEPPPIIFKFSIGREPSSAE